MTDTGLILGFDEVGRGPLAGPVVVACVLGNLKVTIAKDIVIRDSKKMTEKQKIRADIFIRNNFEFGIGQVKALEIDSNGINNGVRKAAMLALVNLKSKTKINFDKVRMLIDGRDAWIVGAETIIKGDNKVMEISMASIVAKVYRDRLMRDLAKKYANYGFDKHVGYGTAEHRQAIIKYGLVKGIHRKSFLHKTKLDAWQD